jgi:hypothetical protein
VRGLPHSSRTITITETGALGFPTHHAGLYADARGLKMITTTVPTLAPCGHSSAGCFAGCYPIGGGPNRTRKLHFHT